MNQSTQQILAGIFGASAAVPEQELAKLGQLCQPYTLAAGQHLLEAGQIPSSLALVVRGLLRLYYLDPAGREWTKSFCLAGEIVAAYSALLLGQPSRLWIDALEPSQLLIVEYHAYQHLASGHPCWARINQQRAEALFIKKEQREAAFLLDDAEARYRQFLIDYPDLEQRVKQHQIASYLGITPVALSRIRARMRHTSTSD